MEITNLGYAVANEGKFNSKTEALVTLEVYNCWVEAAKKLKYKNRPLAEMAPSFPHDVSSIVIDYWKNTYWPRRKKKMSKRIIKRLRLFKND